MCSNIIGTTIIILYTFFVILLLSNCIFFEYICKKKNNEITRSSFSFIFRTALITFSIIGIIHLILFLGIDFHINNCASISSFDIVSLIISAASLVAACSIAHFQYKLAENQNDSNNRIQKIYNDNQLNYSCLSYLSENGFIKKAEFDRLKNKIYLKMYYNVPPILEKNSVINFGFAKVLDNQNEAKEKIIDDFLNKCCIIGFNDDNEKTNNWVSKFLINRIEGSNGSLPINIIMNFNVKVSQDNIVDVTVRFTLYNTEIFNNKMLPTIEIKNQTIVLG